MAAGGDAHGGGAEIEVVAIGEGGRERRIDHHREGGLAHQRRPPRLGARHDPQRRAGGRLVAIVAGGQRGRSEHVAGHRDLDVVGERDLDRQVIDDGAVGVDRQHAGGAGADAGELEAIVVPRIATDHLEHPWIARDQLEAVDVAAADGLDLERGDRADREAVAEVAADGAAVVGDELEAPHGAGLDHVAGGQGQGQHQEGHQLRRHGPR
ncbi:MAG: hypothetical protein R2939_08720 [Kofleriaceae bacterium]